MRSWILRSFKNALVRWLPPPARRVCAKALHAMWQVHVVQHPNVALRVDANALFDEARRENDAVHHRSIHDGAWVALAVLVDAHVGNEICLSCGPPVGCNHPNWTVLCWSLVVPAEKLLVREHHTRQVQRASNAVCHGPRARPRAAARHGKFSTLPSGSPLSISAHGRA